MNTRLSRVQEPVESARHLDAVVLAFAGLIRLWKDPSGREELAQLFQGVRWMVLPLKECPAAPAQGALAVECRADDHELQAMISKLHDPATAVCVAEERKLLSEWGGGCHQRFGATSIRPHGSAKDLGGLLYIRGKKQNGDDVEELRWQGGPPLLSRGEKELHPWDGSQWRPQPGPLSLAEKLDFGKQTAVFIAHSRAAQSLDSKLFESARVWTWARPAG